MYTTVITSYFCSVHYKKFSERVSKRERLSRTGSQALAGESLFPYI